MKPYKVLIFVACVMACLAALCVVLPGRIALGEKELRWPTLAEVISPTQPPLEGEEIEEIDSLSDLSSLDHIDTIEISEPEERLIIPKITVDSTTDSRLFLRAFYASLADAGKKKIRVVH